MKKHFLILSMLFVLVLSFQNCGAPYSNNGRKNGTITKSTSGNGDTYEGKLVVKAPKTFVPGGQITIEISGGQAPYQVTTDSGSALITQISSTSFVISTSNSDSSEFLQVSVIDANGESASATLQALGINRWFFDEPRSVSALPGGAVAFVQKDGTEVVILESNGRYRLQKSLFAADDVPGEITRMTYNSFQNQLILADSFKKQFLMLDLNSQTLTSVRFDAQSCEKVTSMALENTEQLVFICSGDENPRALNLTTLSESSVTLEDSMGPLVSVQNTKEGLFLASSTGYFQLIGSDGQKVRKSRIQHSESEIARHKYIQGFLTQDGYIAFLGSMARIVPIFNWEGVQVRGFAQRGKRPGEFSVVDNLDLTSDGFFVLPDPGFHRINFFRSDIAGKATHYSHSFGSNGVEEGAFASPFKLAYDNDDRLHVLDIGNDRVQIFDTDGTLSEIISSRKSNLRGLHHYIQFSLSKEGYFVTVHDRGRNLQIYDAKTDTVLLSMSGDDIDKGNNIGGTHDALMLPDGRVLVADAEFKCIHVLKDGKYSGRVQPDGDLWLKSPKVLAYDKWNRHIYVVNGSSIHVYDWDLNFLKIIRGEGKAYVWRPADLTIDKNGHLYLADQNNHRVVIIDQEANLVREIGPDLPPEKKFNKPTGLAINSNGTLAVVEMHNHRVQFFPLN